MRIKHYDAPVVLRVIEYKFLKPYLLGNEGVKEFSKLESSFNFGNDIAVGTMTSKRLHYGRSALPLSPLKLRKRQSRATIVQPLWGLTAEGIVSTAISFL